MGRKGTFWLPEQGSTTAHEIDALFYFIMWASLVVFVGVVFFMVYYAWKYRRRHAADRTVEVEPNKWLELSWIVVPTLLVAVVFWWSMTVFIAAGIPPSDSYQINVYGKKWLWDIEYPNGKRTTNELVVPVGVPVQLVMTSTDVLHSFYVPAFRVKKDVVPNRYASVWFEVKEPGDYRVYCTEYCGTDHSDMMAVVRAVDQGSFNTWLATSDNLDAVPLPEIGEQIYAQQACQTCHSIDGSAGTGPSWLGHWGETRQFTDGSSAVMDENYTIQSIVAPATQVVQGYPPSMPAYPNLTERQLQGVVAYIKQLNGAWTDADAAADAAAIAGDSTAVAADSLAAPDAEAPAEDAAPSED